MSKNSEMINRIKKMSVKSKDFFEVYKIVSDKYWTFENPDDAQMCASILVKFAERCEAEQVIVATKIIQQVFEMYQDKEKKTATMMNIGIGDNDYTISISRDGIEREKLESLLGDALKAMESGNIKMNNPAQSGTTVGQ